MPEQNDNRFRGALFDVDGTLTDSNDANARAWVEALREHGYEVPFDKIRRMIGMGGDNLLPQAIGKDKDSPEGKAVSERRGEVFKQKGLPTIQPFPQARELLQRLHDVGFTLVVSSSAKEDEVEALLQLVGASELFDYKTSSSDAKNSKPDPDLIQIALDKGKLSAEQSVMIGDTPYDIEAAQKAGVPTIAFRCGGWSDKDLAGAIAIYDGPADLLAHLAESPLAAVSKS